MYKKESACAGKMRGLLFKIWNQDGLYAVGRWMPASHLIFQHQLSGRVDFDALGAVGLNQRAANLVASWLNAT